MSGLLLLDQQLHDDSGRRQCKRQPGDDGGLCRQADLPSDETDGERADPCLKSPCAEHGPPQGPQLFKRKLEPQQEQEEQHAQFGKGRGGFRFRDRDKLEYGIIVGKRTQRVRSKRDAGQHESDHGGQFQIPEDRNRHTRRKQEDDCVLDQNLVSWFRHASL